MWRPGAQKLPGDCNTQNFPIWFLLHFLNWLRPGICIWTSLCTSLCLTLRSGLHIGPLPLDPCVPRRVRALHGFLVNFVFVIYAFLFEFEFDSSNIADETFYNHDFGYEKKGPATCKSLSQKTVALTQNWGDSFERHQIAQDFDHPEGPSFKGSQFPCDHSSSNGRQSAVEVCRVPPTTQTRCNILPDLSAALAKCHRQDVCSSTRWPTRTSYRGLELRSAQLGLYTTMESGKAALAISNAEVQATLQQCEDTEGAAQRTRQRTWGRHGQRQRCGGTTSTTTDTMAWLRHAWTSSSTHAHAAAPPDDDCDQYRHFICRLQLACHAAATGPASYNLDNLSGTELRGEGVGRDDQNKADGTATRYEDESPKFCQEGRCKSYERLAYSCPTSGTCQTGSRGCLTSTFQPHRIMENLPYRCNPHMAGIRDALSTAGEGRPGQDPRSAGPVQPGQCQLEQSQTAAGKVKTIVIKDEDEEIAEGQASISSASDKIHDSFKTLSTSLLQLQAQTEQIETAMQAAKRPRLSIPSTVDQSMETTEEGQNPPKGRLLLRPVEHDLWV